MIAALTHMICFVTISVSFICGTVICVKGGKRCTFDQPPEVRKQKIQRSLPVAMAIYSFGFMVLLNHFFETYWKFTVFALTSALVLTAFVTSMAMPELRRGPSNRT